MKTCLRERMWTMRRWYSFIRTVQTPNPQSLKFLPGCDIMGDQAGVEMMNRREGLKSPLSKRLFTVDGVRSVFLGRDFLSVNKAEEADWDEIKPQVYSCISEWQASGDEILSEGVAEDSLTILPDDSETVAMIKELLDSRIRIAVQEDGGDILYHGFDASSGVVFLQLIGSCSGCPSSTVTLKNGIERMLMHWVAEVTGVKAIESETELEVIARQVFDKFEETKKK